MEAPLRTACVTLVAMLTHLSACGGDAPNGNAMGGRSGSGGGGTGGASNAGTSGSVATGGSVSGGSGGSGIGGAAGGGGDATGGVGGTAGGSGGASAGQGGSGGSPLPPVTDYAAPGPFTTKAEGGMGPEGKYRIVRPEKLGENGFLHAPIMFGPGTGMEVMQLDAFLSRIASHGFVIIGARLDGGPGNPASKETMLTGLNWILEQSSTNGSIFEGKLDVKHAIAMGYSVGGTAAVEIGEHEAVATVVSIHGHDASSALHGPLLQTSGIGDNVGLPLQQSTFMKSQVQTFLGIVAEADHFYIQGTHDGVPGGVETPAIIGWLRYWIYRDEGGKKFFYGDDCVMCSSPWTMPQRKNWQ